MNKLLNALGEICAFFMLMFLMLVCIMGSGFAIYIMYLATKEFFK